MSDFLPARLWRMRQMIEKQEQQIQEIKDREMSVGDRFRVVGSLPISRLEYNPEVARKYEANGAQIDTWATVSQISLKRDNMIHITFDSIEGTRTGHWFQLDEIALLMENGKRAQQNDLSITDALAQKCINESRSPVYLSTTIEEMLKNDQIQIGKDLIIYGVNYGSVKESIINDGVAVVVTDTHMLTNIDITPAIMRHSLNIGELTQQIDGVEALDRDALRTFIVQHNGTLPIRVQIMEPGKDDYPHVDVMLSSEQFTNELCTAIANYMHKNQISSLNELDQKATSDLINIIKCEVDLFGFAKHEKPRPTEAELAYLQSLGYSTQDMDEKSEILAKWLDEKELTASQRAVALSMIEKKILHVVQDVDLDNLKKKSDIPLVNIYTGTDDIRQAFVRGARMTADHINLALGTHEQGQIEISACDAVYRFGIDQFVAVNENEMWVTWDVSKEYAELGGFDYETALMMAQSSGKSQKTDSQTINEQSQDAEDKTQTNVFEFTHREL